MSQASVRLTWADLFTDARALDMERVVAQWPNTLVGTLRPIGASAFGDLYFERPDGRVERLDVLEGGVHPVAKDATEFAASMNVGRRGGC